MITLLENRNHACSVRSGSGDISAKKNRTYNVKENEAKKEPQ
jgi:hypothetical protein